MTGAAIGLGLAGLSFITPRPPPPAAEPEARGAWLYAARCAVCHGPAGRGDGPSAAGLRPPPRDFAGPGWRFERTPASVARVVREGVPGTAMPGHAGALPDDDVGLLAAHVLRLAGAAPAADEPADRRLLREAGFADLRGADCPPLTVYGADGAAVRLADLGGRPVLVYFWGAGSAGELQAVRAVEKAFAGRLAVLYVWADSDDAAEGQARADREVRGLQVLADEAGVGLHRFTPRPLPTAWLVGADGGPVGRSAGPVDWGDPVVRRLLGRWCDGL